MIVQLCGPRIWCYSLWERVVGYTLVWDNCHLSLTYTCVRYNCCYLSLSEITFYLNLFYNFFFPINLNVVQCMSCSWWQCSLIMKKIERFKQNIKNILVTKVWYKRDIFIFEWVFKTCVLQEYAYNIRLCHMTLWTYHW